MSTGEVHTARERNSDVVSALTAMVVTTATFAKSFVPFYLIGSTAIFAVLCLLGCILIALQWRSVLERARFGMDFILIATLLYAFEAARYLADSSHQVPVTHLLGVLGFHSFFLLFGFAAARCLAAIHMVLIAQGMIYLIVIVHFTIIGGDVMQGGYLQDIFGINVPALSIALHQHIGTALSLAMLAALGFKSRWVRLSALMAVPFLLLFFFHIAARAALAALVATLLFRLSAKMWMWSRRITALWLVLAAILTAAASLSFYNFAIKDRSVGIQAAAPDAVSRTIRELQSDDPGFRLPIWRRAWQRIESSPRDLIFGRGVGSYSIDEGFGPPTWLLDKTPKHYPHNTLLEMLYETGIVGLTLFGALISVPLLVSVKNWTQFSAQQKAAISIYVYYLAIIQLSGAFAFDYTFEFFLALAIGVIAITRVRLREPRLENLPTGASA